MRMMVVLLRRWCRWLAKVSVMARLGLIKPRGRRLLGH